MNSLNRRQLTLSLLAGSLSMGLGACSTTHNVAKLPITHPDRAADFEEWWVDLQKRTTAIPISDDRVHIRSFGNFRSKESIPEQNFLLRSAAETLRVKKHGFVILHLDYYKHGLSLPSLGTNLSVSTRRWIGNYEDLREDRNEQNIFSSRRKVRKKAIDGVILYLNKDDFPNRDRFSAEDIYLNLLNHQGA